MTVDRTISFSDLTELLRASLIRHGCSDTVAEVLADNYARAERDGSASHGVFRMEGLIKTLSTDWVNGRAVPVVEDVAPGLVRVDAANGFAQPALAAARELFVEKCRTNGIALLMIQRSHHFGALWPDVEPFADEGLIALSMVNSMTCAVPYGANKAVFGTNPIGFAAPVGNGAAPVVLDMATTTMSHGDVQLARRHGKTLPDGVGFDAAGKPTNDPAAILEGGALAPFGAHKGSAISMMVELLCAGLSGGNFSWEFSWDDHPGAQTPCTGQIIIGISPETNSTQSFLLRAEVLIAKLRDAGLSVYPGLRRRAVRARNDANGIPLSSEMLALLKNSAV